MEIESLVEIQRLRDRITELEGLLGIDSTPKPFHVGTYEWLLFKLLIKRKLVTREVAFIALYGNRIESEQPGSFRMIDVLIRRLRLALKTAMLNDEIVIHTERPSGYYLDEKSRKYAAALVGHQISGNGATKHLDRRNWDCMPDFREV